jgi:divalent metal cation (Fe/Co/Zn/Cd) transporter
MAARLEGAVPKRSPREVSFWVTCIAAILFAIAMGASFPWGYVIVAVVVAVFAFQMGRKVGKDPVWTLFINRRPEKPRRSSSSNLIASARTRARSASR